MDGDGVGGKSHSAKVISFEAAAASRGRVLSRSKIVGRIEELLGSARSKRKPSKADFVATVSFEIEFPVNFKESR